MTFYQQWVLLNPELEKTNADGTVTFRTMQEFETWQAQRMVNGGR